MCPRFFLFLAGYIERWGSGIEKMNRLAEEYSLPAPAYEEVNGSFIVTFKRAAANEQQRDEQVNEQVGEQVDEQVGESSREILKFCITPRRKQDILTHVNLAPVYMNYKRHILPLLKKRLLTLTIPDKPQSSKQRYVVTDQGRKVLL